VARGSEVQLCFFQESAVDIPTSRGARGERAGVRCSLSWLVPPAFRQRARKILTRARQSWRTSRAGGPQEVWDPGPEMGWQEPTYLLGEAQRRVGNLRWEANWWGVWLRT
jgi:hypothetical protein